MEWSSRFFFIKVAIFCSNHDRTRLFVWRFVMWRLCKVASHFQQLCQIFFHTWLVWQPCHYYITMGGPGKGLYSTRSNWNLQYIMYFLSKVYKVYFLSEVKHIIPLEVKLKEGNYPKKIVEDNCYLSQAHIIHFTNSDETLSEWTWSLQ